MNKIGRPKLYYTEEELKERKKIHNSKYYENNSDKIKENKIKYYREHKQINHIHDNSNICICGGYFSHFNLKKHENTKKHKDYIKMNLNILK